MSRKLKTPINTAIGSITAMLLSAHVSTANAEFEKSSVYWLEDGAPEIVAAAHTKTNGYVLAYTNSDEESVGFLDIDTVPGGGQPGELFTLDLAALPELSGAAQAEPTAVAATPDQKWFVIAVNTSMDKPNGGSGVAVVVSAETFDVAAVLDLPGQPDSVAASKGKSNYVAVAIENETDEDSNNNLGTGTLSVIQTKPRHKPAKWKVRNVDLTGLPINRPDDPEPEFVDVNDKDIAAVTLQENNAVVLVDLKSRKVTASWDAGNANQAADITEDDIIDFSESIAASPRTPDAISWTEMGYVALANEGEANFTGGRSVSVHMADSGAIVDDPLEVLELWLVAHGHYQDGRSANKGAEFEGVESGVYNGSEYIFGAAERGAGITVQSGDDFSFVQLLPLIGESEPEGLLAIPELGLFAAADEENGKVVFYEYGTTTYPNVARLTAFEEDIGTFGSIGWGALSGFGNGAGSSIYAVPDSAYASSVYELDVAGYNPPTTPATIVNEVSVTDPGELLPTNNFGESYLTDGDRALLDLEGVSVRLDGSGDPDWKNLGAWLVTEGENRADRNVRPNLLVKIGANGVIQQVVTLPFTVQTIALTDDDELTGETRDVSSNINRFGFEGVTVTGSEATADELVYVAFQRTWAGDDPGIARIGVYDPGTGDWSFYGYELDGVADNPGLSEIVALDDTTFAVIERDGANGSVEASDGLFKVVRTFSIDGITPTANPADSVVNLTLASPSLVTPTTRFDLVGKTPGDDLEKWEGLAVKGDTVYAGNDNDGFGETRLVLFPASHLSDPE
jgi:hypothetical protein